MHGIIRHWKLGVVGVLWISLLFMGSTVANSQHDHTMHKAPAAKKPTRKRAPRRKPRRTARKPAAPKASPSPTPHQHVPGMPMPAASPTASPHQHVPGMPMPAASPAASPHQHTPGMPMPAASPAASPHQHTPGMPMPAASPAASPHQHTPGMPMPAASPAASPHQHTPGMPMPTASPSASPHQHMPAATPESTETPTQTPHQHLPVRNIDPSKVLPPLPPMLVMIGDDMGIRVGSSDKNVMSMGAMGSGTSWQPSSGPMFMQHWSKNDWLVMLHYNIVAGMNRQGGPRGVTKAESANWFMPMAFHKLGRGTLQLRGMFSFEPFTFPPGGSPLLFQTGETYKGEPIIDRQHPHDLFMELSAQYTHPLGERGTWFTYFGYPGEPALGPTAFMHRASASENSSAVLSHHLMDSSHITFGVLTTGFTYRWFRLEGSIFNGREPDENRYNFDAHKWNSRSARFTVMPNPNWVFQISHGFLRDPEAQAPGDVRRTTASIMYTRRLQRGSWATSLIWGRNHESHGGEIANLNGYVAESTVNFLDKNYLYTRLELVDKNSLLRDADRLRLGIIDHHASFRIGAYTFGGVRDVWNTKKVSVGIGSDITVYSKPAILNPIYGDNPVSWKIFFRLRPAKMDMSRHSGHP